MSTVSASSYDLSSNPVKRKRGRPRKEEASGSESNRRVLQGPNSNIDLVGQEVSGFFVGVFDAGYLLTVQVGSSGPFMNGLVFDPQLAVPISAENDVAPHLPMLKRMDLFPPVKEDFFNRGTNPSQVDMALKNPMEGHAPQASSQTMRPTTIFFGGAAAETSSHPQSQIEGTSISAGLMDVSKPSNGYDPSAVKSSLGASKDASADISQKTLLVNVSEIPEGSEATPHAFSEALNIPKEALSTSTEGLPFKIAPSADFNFNPPEDSVISHKFCLDEISRKADFEVGRILEHKTEETRGTGLSSQESDEPSKDRGVNDSLAGFNSISEILIGAKPYIPVAENLEDGRTASEAFQP